MKKVLSLILAAMLAFSSVPGVFAAFADEANWPSSVSWAKNQINYMVEKGVLNGYWEDNTFRPADPVTRVQFIKMIVETFGLTKTATVSYTDVKSTDWFYPYVQKAVAQGFLLNYGTKLNPNGELTREEAASLLARYLELDADKKSPTSTYKDYNSIKSEYRNYVLQATYEGLFNGDDTGNFSPTRVLRRCEAAAILYRAAGTIYKASATGTDAGAADENAVIAKSGVTVTNATIDGKLYISEGASGGTVTLSGCDAETVIVRATSSLILSDCEIDEIIVDCATAGYTSNITMIGETTAEKITAKTPIEISLGSRCGVDELVVESTAKNSSVTGSGALKSVKIKATGFESEKVPEKYEISSGISATFANSTYSGATADTSASGFATTPSMYTTTANAYLKVKPSVGGVLYYYYTNTATAPTKTNYITNYTAASAKSNFTVTANSPYDKEIGKTADISGYSYVAVMLQATDGTMYQPMLLANKSSSGFVSTPTLSVSGSYDRITVKTTVSGQVSYYYSKTNTAPTVDTFSTLYNAAAYKGVITVTANQQAAKNTVVSTNVASYSYVILMVKDASGNTYQPIVLSKDGSSSGTTTDTGFTTTPFCQTTNDKIYLGMVAEAAGTVQYYYTNSGTLPTSAQFTTNLSSAQTSAKGTISVQKDASYYAALSNQTVAKSYKYMVLRLTASGVTYHPVLVALPAAQDSNLTGTGFSVTPTSSMTSGYFYLSVNVTSPGTLYYYITDNETVPSTAVFESNWATKTSKYLAAPSGGASTVRAGSQSIKTAITNEVGTSATYIVLMNVISGQKMNPVVIPLTGGTTGETVVQPTTTGFMSTPSYSVLEKNRYHQITVKPNISGTVYYFYTDNATAPSADEIKRIVEAEISAGQITGTYAGTSNVLAKQSVDIQVQIINQIVLDYVVLMMVDGNGVAYRPVVIRTTETGSGTSTETTADAGFVTRPTAKLSGTSLTLTYNATAAGQLLYYFSTSPVAPADSAAFVNMYYLSGLPANTFGMLSVNAGSGTKTITAPSGYSYIVLMLQKTSANADEALFKPIVVSVNGAAVGGTTGFYGTPYVSNDTLHYYPIMTGTFAYYFTNTDNEADFKASLVNQPALAAMGGTVTISSTGQRTLNLASANTALGNLAKNFDNIVIWMSSGSVTTEYIFVSLSGGTGTSSGQATSAGFTEAPYFNGSRLLYTSNITGTMKCFYTNATQNYNTASSFLNAMMASNAMNTMAVTKDKTSFIETASYASYKYLWIMMTSGTTNYTPVRIQLP